MVINSTREYQVVYWDEKYHFIETTFNLKELCENKDDTSEMVYALQERFDEILDMKVNDKIAFNHNRDDKNSLALIVRFK